MIEATLHGKVRFWCDSFRVLATGNHWTKPPALVSFVGPHNAVRGAWAALVAARKNRSSGVCLGDDNLMLAEDTHYISVRCALQHQMLQLVILHPAATAQVSPFAEGFYQIGSRPEAIGFARLSRLCAVPFRPTWQVDIWRLGLGAGLIRLCDGFGLPVHYVDTDKDRWAAAVGEAIRAGVLA